MKFLIAILGSTLLAQPAFAGEVLRNCYGGTGTQFFVSELGKISEDQETPLLLLNDKKEVVGVISVLPKRQKNKGSEIGEISEISVNKISLCSSLETSDFYYSDGDASDLMKWVDAGGIEITQDEGLIELEASVVKKESYATLIKVKFKAYDVFEEDPAQYKGKPDYKEDWGIPKGKGVFYFYVPAAWAK